jgi:hypothetical protein
MANGFWQGAAQGLPEGVRLGAHGAEQARRRKDEEEAKRLALEREKALARLYQIPRASKWFKAVEEGTQTAIDARDEFRLEQKRKKTAEEEAATSERSARARNVLRQELLGGPGGQGPLTQTQQQRVSDFPGLTPTGRTDELTRVQKARQPTSPDPQQAARDVLASRIQDPGLRQGFQAGLITPAQAPGVLPESQEDKGPTRTQVINAQFDKDNPELRAAVQEQVTQNFGQFHDWALSKMSPDQRDLVHQKEAGAGREFGQFDITGIMAPLEKEYTKSIEGLVDKAIDRLRRRALAGEDVSMPGIAQEAGQAALEARAAALDRALDDAERELRELRR